MSAHTSGPARVRAQHPRARGRIKHAGSGLSPLQLDNLLELEALAARVIPRPGFDYIAGGAGDEQTLRENRAAFARVFVDQRVLTGKTVSSTQTSLLGSTIASPVIVSAMGAQAIAHVSAESGMAQAASQAGTLLQVSTVSSHSLEQIAAAAVGDKWFQLYLTRDDGFNRELLARARAAGYKAIVFTVDVSIGGNRERYRATALDPRLSLGNGLPPHASGSGFADRIGPERIAWIAGHAGLPVIVKGIATAADAELAIDHGAAALQVSNHGGRQLDGAPATFSVLPEVTRAVRGRVPLILDSGIRRGLDVFKAIAAGADAVALGRPLLYGLALGGWQGALSVLLHLDRELRIVMQLAGAATLEDIRTTPLRSTH
ncbi:MAG: alpha-hydroxy-acid oxidizing protein [Pseudomonas sp.]